MQKDLDALVARLKTAHGAQLVSVVLYGSAASGEHDPAFSDINILCVLQQITPAELRASEPVFRWWTGQGHPPTLMLSEHEVETSTDCFAIEFHDIKQRHRILHGKDVVSGLTVDNSFYRAQVERELRAKLLRLRTKAAQALSDKEMLARLLADSISTFCVLLRHALLLHGNGPEPRKRAIIEGCRQVFGLDPAPFLKLIDAREGKIAMKDLDPEPVLTAYLRELSIAIDAVDRLNK
jgi:hypothetical protein